MQMRHALTGHIHFAAAIPSLLENRHVRTALKATGALATTAAMAFAAAVIHNAFDQDLSPRAKALLTHEPMGRIDDSNGYIAFLGLTAPEGEDSLAWGRRAAAALTEQAQPAFTPTPAWTQATRPHLKFVTTTWCKPDCVSEARSDPGTVAARLANGTNAQLLARYRLVRAAPVFADLDFGPFNTGASSSYSALAAGALLALGNAAIKAEAGDLAGWVAEMESETQFHRRMVSDGMTLATVMVGETLLARDLLAISAVLKAGGQRVAPYLARLQALTAPELNPAGIQAATRRLGHENVSWAQAWRKLYIEGGMPVSNWATSLFIQPNATANVVAAVMADEASLATASAARYDRERGAIRSANAARLDRPWYGEASNPVGKSLMELVTGGSAKYVARFHDVRALARMVDLQVTLARLGGSEPAATAAFVASDSVGVPRDPYRDAPFAFDPAKRLISFEPRGNARWTGQLKKTFDGRVAIAL